MATTQGTGPSADGEKIAMSNLIRLDFTTRRRLPETAEEPDAICPSCHKPLEPLTREDGRIEVWCVGCGVRQEREAIRG